MKLAIGISTMNDGIQKLKSNLKGLDGLVDVIICHQITNGKEYNYDGFLDSGSITILTKLEKGLSRSRNSLLEGAYYLNIDYLLISDDDVEYNVENLKEFKGMLSERIGEHGHYQIKSSDELGMDRKQYRSHAFELSFLNIFKVSSIEMCLNTRLLREKNICFDEDFGLGSKYPVGEEAVLLSDIINNGQKIFFVPSSITIHPVESTGSLLFIEKRMVSSRGAMFRRCCGPVKGVVFILMFWVKKFLLRKKYKKDISVLESLKLLWRGYLGNAE